MNASQVPTARDTGTSTIRKYGQKTGKASPLL